MLRAVIVEDSGVTSRKIKEMVNQYCPQVNIVAIAADVAMAQKAIIEHAPDLVFLDIKLPDGTAFDLLGKIGSIEFKIIFITAYEEYAIKALKLSAVDYLLKPLVAEQLQEAVKKVDNIIQQDEQLKLKALFFNMGNIIKQEKKLVLKTSEKIQIVNTADIVRCEADDSYTKFYLIDGRSVLVSNTLKDYEELLTEHNFFRVHQSHLVNLNFVDCFMRGDGGFILMKDKNRIPVSLRKKESFLKRLGNI